MVIHTKGYTFMNITILRYIVFLVVGICFFNLNCASTNDTTTKKTKKNREQKVVDAATIPVADDTLSFDEAKKKQEVIALVKKGVDYLKNHRIPESAHAFTYAKDFIAGELYLFLHDNQGVVLAQGGEPGIVWHNLQDQKDKFGTRYMEEILKVARSGGGWVTYEWRGTVKQSYVEIVQKDGKEYVLGSGYYPHSKIDQVVSLVKGATSLAREFIKRGDPIEQAFSIMSYPGSKQFVRGDLYIYVIREDGQTLAHGERPGLIGTNALNYQDTKGKYVNKEIFAALEKNPEGGAWVEYISKGARKKAYAELLVGPDGKKYFVACGYYPDLDRNDVVSLVKKAYSFMKANGESKSFGVFSDIKDSEFHLGDLYITIYNMQGVCVANGKNIELVGKNMMNQKDEDGILYVKEIFNLINKSGQGWTDASLNNSFLSIYSEKIDLGLEQFIITCGTYPVSKPDVISLLVKSAVSVLEAEPIEKAFFSFVEPKSSFVRGDLSIFVFDDSGLCYAHGLNVNLIWKNLIHLKDDQGKEFVKLMIESAKNGPTHLSFVRGGKPYVTYIQRVEKNGIHYTVGSGFYK
jgi:signal transduction histidine kinase